MNDYIMVSRHIKPDFSFVTFVKDYSGKQEPIRLCFLFSEMLYTRQKCNESGIPLDGWQGEVTYHPCRLVGEEVMIINSKYGWEPNIEMTMHYQSFIADKELLNDR